jgi:hypothetical protein
MREGVGEGLGRVRGFVIGSDLRSSGKFPQDCIYEGSGGAFAGALHEFDAFVESRALRDAIEPEELIEGEAQGDENFDVEF